MSAPFPPQPGRPQQPYGQGPHGQTPHGQGPGGPRPGWPGAPQAAPVVLVQRRSTLLAYVLWFLLGHLGVHKMYVGKWGAGIAQLILFWFGALTAAVIIGWIPLAVWFVWWVWDAVTLPAQVFFANERAARRAAAGLRR